MGRTKEFMINSIPEEELEGYIYNADLRDAEYDEWLKSDDFINMINEELDRAKPIYSQYDIAYALNYAKSGIIVEASEIGSDVYNTLFSEKVFEYLNKLYER
jgi:hypothetical protein